MPITLDGTAGVTGAQFTATGAGIQFSDSSLVVNAPPLAFKNLQASATGTSANVSVSADMLSLFNTAFSCVNARSVSLTINSAASGANGLDTGTVAASTWYSIWVIYNGTTVAGLLSTSATAPTMPSGYTYKTRIGWTYTDATANKYPFGFTQRGRTVQYLVGAGTNITTPRLIASGVNGASGVGTITWVSASVSNFVPSTATRIAVTVGGGSAAVNLAPNGSYGSYDSGNGFVSTTTNSGANNHQNSWLTLESTNISIASGSSTAKWTCTGWEDNL